MIDCIQTIALRQVWSEQKIISKNRKSFVVYKTVRSEHKKPIVVSAKTVRGELVEP
ncbi:Uncharacterised protein [Moraxella caviae]|uniref:Uncharacterized protein n=1 Tax=Moraxella caviae TaxID=34060 RepID=A0A378R9T6_9GAMM|nr:Uncharacterised protein [Moraxella caviae]VEW12917.1 Uncharacterised protein [Moraxella caviae]